MILLIKRYIVILRNIFRFSFGKPKKYFVSEEKTSLNIFIELLQYFLQTGEFNDMYYCAGLNEKIAHPNSFIPKKRWNAIIELENQKIRNQSNAISKTGFDIIAKDKFYLSSLLESNAIPVVRTKALISYGNIIVKEKKYKLDHLFNFNFPIIIKNTLLEYNEGLLLMDEKNRSYTLNDQVVENKDQILERVKKGNWIIQDIARSSKEIELINKTALNTTRIVTRLQKGVPKFMAGFQSFATRNQITDSWGKGAVYVGFNYEKETLKKYGFFHPSDNEYSLLSYHPDSNIEFENYKIPGLAEAVELCIEAHRYLYYHYLIGWDVAITDEGPKIVEANEKPGMNAVQCIDKTINKSIEELL